MQGHSYVDSARYAKLLVRVWQTLPRLCSQALHLCATFTQEQAEIASLASKIAAVSSVKDDVVSGHSSDVQSSWTVLELNIGKCATSLTAFRSTYLCESVFSHMKLVKPKFHQAWWSFRSVLEAGYQRLLTGLCIPGLFHSEQVLRVR